MKKIITFSLLFLLASGGIVAAQETDESTDEIQETVNDRLENVRNRLKAMTGTVTDKTENTMQLETDLNEIGLITLAENATYADSKGSSGNIEYDDIGIGDYVITMGTFDDNNVLTAQRIVVSEQPIQILQEVLYGTVTDFEDKLVVQLLPDSTELLLEVNRTMTITEYDEEGIISELTSNALDPDDKIILVGTRDEGEFVATRIHIVEQAPEEE